LGCHLTARNRKESLYRKNIKYNTGNATENKLSIS